MSPFSYDVYGLGNALMDHIVCVPDALIDSLGLTKGQMTEMRADDQQGVLRACGAHSVVRQGGGSAANTVVAVASLGGRAGYACCVAADSEGKAYVSDLSKAGVQLSQAHLTPGAQKEQTGTCLVLVTPDGARTMLTHLGITKNFSIHNLNQQALLDAHYIYIEGYLVATEKGFSAMQKAQSIATQAPNARTVLTLSDMSMVTHFKARLLQLLKKPVHLLFCNEAEALAFTETNTVAQAAEVLKKYANAFVITRGPMEVYAYADGKLHILPVYSAKVLDTNGAGDMFAGATLYGLAQSWPLEKAIQLAAWTAARLVERIGARLNETEWAQIKKWMNANKKPNT